MGYEKILSENVFFDNLNLVEAAEQIRLLSLAPAFSYVVTPNIDHLARVSGDRANEELKSIYKNASLSLCDSRIVDKLLRFKNKKIKEVVPGSSLTQYLFSDVLTDKDKILIVGVEQHYIDKLRGMYPRLTIEHINPTMGFINKSEEVESLIKSIESLNANYIFLSVGSPRQEVLAGKIAKSSSASGVALCVGASILFIVGAESRAPAFLQKLHLEWAYRMLQNPRRLFMRYAQNFLSLPVIYRHL